MAAIAINPIIKINSTPFCDTSCKGIRVFGQFMGRSLYALSLLIASVACRVFSRDLACTYFSMARTQFNRGGNALVAYYMFGERLIDFSYNGCVIAPSSDTEQNALKSRYGSDVIDQWLRIGTEEIPLKLEKLKSEEEGICLGMTLDFIKHYLQQIQAGLSPMEAIRKISSRYVTGAPDQAQLAQIFFSALDPTPAIKKAWALIYAPLKKRLEEQFAVVRKLTPEGLLQMMTKVREYWNNFFDHALPQMKLAIAQIPAQRMEIVTNQFGLQQEPAQIYTCKEISAECDAEFSQFLKKLPNGCYVGVFQTKECPHAVTLIKSSDNQYFLFDPNFGTMVFRENEIAKNLWNTVKSFYLKNGSCNFSFSQVHKKS